MKQFPYEYEARKKVLFHPEQRESIAGDFLEIGPGRGDFLMDLAERYPDKHVVGMELSTKRYYKLKKRVEKRELSNVTLMRVAAQIGMPRYLVEESFERAYVLFPDPWPKKRHAPHRLLNTDVLKLLARILKPGADLFFATDFVHYAEWVVENLQEVSALQNTGDPYTSQADIADYFPSFFEQMWREEGRSIYYLRCTRV